ncbi:hypothetical protein Hanom_Chr11g01041551 [Helianthus anomalus]
MTSLQFFVRSLLLNCILSSDMSGSVLSLKEQLFFLQKCLYEVRSGHRACSITGQSYCSEWADISFL